MHGLSVLADTYEGFLKCSLTCACVLPRYMQKAQLAGSVTAAEFRELYERALNIAGLHVTLGSQLWALSRCGDMP